MNLIPYKQIYMNGNYVSTRIAISDEQISHSYKGFIRSETIEDHEYK